MMVREITTAATSAATDGHLIDVREVDEFQEVAAQGARNFPLSGLDPQAVLAALKVDPATADTPLYLICKVGGRSQRAAQMFIAAGYSNVFNVTGGMVSWLNEGLPLSAGCRE